MDRNKIYYLLYNEKQTLVSCTFENKQISKVLKYKEKNWIEDAELETIIKKCYPLNLMGRISKKITSDYDLRKVVSFKDASENMDNSADTQ